VTEPARRLVEVALPVPLFQTFVYSLDGEYEHAVSVGSRVLVPFRKRNEIGIVVALDVAPPSRGTVKPVAGVPDAEPALDDAVLALSRWISEYYVVPLGVVVRTVLPALLTGAAQPHPSVKTRRIVRIRDDIPTLLQREKAFARAPQQRALFELIESLGGATTVNHLLEQLRFSPSVLKGLEKRALIAIDRERVDRDPFASRIGRREPRHEPTPEQHAAISRMASAHAGEVFLLHGVTGSGKTLVYIELLREIVERRGKTAIVLVPEIALTPQTVDRFRAVFGDDVSVLHSPLSDGERYDAWPALKRGEKRIAVGAR
jgi:primosomal protein N' (replication factor Y)